MIDEEIKQEIAAAAPANLAATGVHVITTADVDVSAPLSAPVSAPVSADAGIHGDRHIVVHDHGKSREAS